MAIHICHSSPLQGQLTASRHGEGEGSGGEWRGGEGRGGETGERKTADREGQPDSSTGLTAD